MADIATAGQTLTVIESVPLLQDEALPAVDDELQVQPSVPSLNESVEVVETPYGSVSVTLQGDSKKPAIVTYHDVGMNHNSCFNTFMSDENMAELLPLFYWVHIDAPGQEDEAATFPDDYVYPSVNELTEQVGIIVEYLHLSYFVGFGVGAGANIITRYAMLSPDRVRGLILVNFTTDSLHWDNLSYYTNKLAVWLLKTNKLPDKVEKYLRSHSFSSSSDSDQSDVVSATYHHYYQKQNTHNIRLFLDSYSRRSSLYTDLVQDTLAQSHCQWLFILSNPQTESNVSEFKGLLDPTKCTVLELYESDQLVLEEHPEKVATSFRLFLQGLGHAVTLGVQPALSSVSANLRGVTIKKQQD